MNLCKSEFIKTVTIVDYYLWRLIKLKKRILSALLALTMLIGTGGTTAVYAEDLVVDGDSTFGTQEQSVSVLCEKPDNFSVFIPKTITLTGENNEFDYTVKVTGDIASSSVLSVTPESSFLMKEQTDYVVVKPDVTATVTQDKTTWRFDEFDTVGNGNVSAQDITAGIWEGALFFDITLQTNVAVDDDGNAPTPSNPTSGIEASVKDAEGNDVEVTVTPIPDDEREGLLDDLVDTGVIGSLDDVDTVVDIEVDELTGQATVVMTLRGMAEPGDKVAVYHYDEAVPIWELVATEVVDENYQIQFIIDNFSPFAFINLGKEQTDEGGGDAGEGSDSTEHTHVYKEEITTAATCTTNGLKTFTCECGNTYTEDIVAEHNWSAEYTVDNKATCTTTGSKSIHCSNCSEKKDITEVAATGHAFENAVCKNCGEAEVLEAGLYGTDGKIKYTWEELILNKIVVVESGSLKQGENASLLSGKLVIDDSVTYIYDIGKNNKTLTDIVFPNTVTTIGGNAFAGFGLPTLKLPSSLERINENAFAGYSALRYIEIPESVTYIGNTAFGGTGLRAVYIAGTPTIRCEGTAVSAVYAPFYNCNSGLTIYCKAETKPGIWAQVWNHLNKYSENTFETHWGVTVEEFRNVVDMFYGNSSEVVELADGISNIPVRAFADNTKVKQVIIPEGVTEIRREAFKGCTNLESISIPSSVVTIDDYAFQNCINLVSIDLPDGLTKIGGYAFKGCTALKDITVPGGVEVLTSSEFADCTALETVVISDGVKEISYAFQGCTNLKEVVLSSTLTKIGSYAFKGCALTSVVIPDTLTEIGSYAFQNCVSLNSIVLPKGLISIGDYAFAADKNLVDLVIPDTVTTIGTKAFNSVPHITYNGEATGSPWGATTIN